MKTIPLPLLLKMAAPGSSFVTFATDRAVTTEAHRQIPRRMVSTSKVRIVLPTSLEMKAATLVTIIL